MVPAPILNLQLYCSLPLYKVFREINPPPSVVETQVYTRLNKLGFYSHFSAFQILTDFSRLALCVIFVGFRGNFPDLY
jgi:hypothetical protein